MIEKHDNALLRLYRTGLRARVGTRAAVGGKTYSKEELKAIIRANASGRVADKFGVGFLINLATRESGLDASAQSKTGAVGLFQIVDSARKDYNKAHGTSYTDPDIMDPEKNAKIGVWLLNTIMGSWEGKYPWLASRTPEDYAQFLLWGWNSGWSSAAGAGKILEWMGSTGRQTMRAAEAREALVSGKYPPLAGVSKYLRDPAKFRWSQGTVAEWLRQSGKTPAPDPVPSPDPGHEDANDYREPEDKGETVSTTRKVIMAAAVLALPVGGFILFKMMGRKPAALDRAVVPSARFGRPTQGV